MDNCPKWKAPKMFEIINGAFNAYLRQGLSVLVRWTIHIANMWPQRFHE